ncbi:hypothetical protein HPP92_012906 [Vanilla planifolia]|uniref:Uncharacterized protein n=1 Tax=Vanilla planifolia TaxID=51239 RepID=A0A835R0Y3_VANPL|nr:hypothetical protein HPP92_012906 [Vanilla planifolia]
MPKSHERVAKHIVNVIGGKIVVGLVPSTVFNQFGGQHVMEVWEKRVSWCDRYKAMLEDSSFHVDGYLKVANRPIPLMQHH